ncbi:MAG TPA: hypothetical protein VF535_02580 [Allosphingosinicella sp.]
MRWTAILAAAAASIPAVAAGEAPRVGAPLAQACASLPVADACEIIAEATRMLDPSYRPRKATDGVAALQALGYNATYIPARAGGLQGVTDVFLASKPRSNRLYIVITGTESKRDWLENAKFRSYTSRFKDGQFYVPPGHAGFRRGMLNIVNDDVIRINEFDSAALDCSGPDRKRSRISQHICRYGLPRTRGAVETVIVGHSRGAGIGVVTATAFSGLEIVRPVRGGPAEVKRQAHWPLSVKAVIAFAPPYAVYRSTDRQLGVEVPSGMLDQWEILSREGLPAKTISFVNEQDIVPLLSLGLGRQFGHRFRIDRHGGVIYEGGDWGPDSDLKRAHSSHFYCTDVLAALGRSGRCPDRPAPMGGDAP